MRKQVISCRPSSGKKRLSKIHRQKKSICGPGFCGCMRITSRIGNESLDSAAVVSSPADHPEPRKPSDASSKQGSFLAARRAAKAEWRKIALLVFLVLSPTLAIFWFASQAGPGLPKRDAVENALHRKIDPVTGQVSIKSKDASNWRSRVQLREPQSDFIAASASPKQSSTPSASALATASP